MKKIIWIITLLTYLFSASSLAHAGMMGFFGDHPMWATMNNSTVESISSADSCDDNNDTTDQKKGHQMECCDFANSSQYNQSEIRSRDSIKVLSLEFSTIDTPINTRINYINIYKPYLSFSPWRDPDIKYQKFSDLVWVIVNII